MSFTYSYSLLHNRVFGLVHHLVTELEAATVGTDVGSIALGAILLSDTAVEIAVNHTIETAFPPRGMMPEHWPVHQFATEHLKRLRPPLERLKALAKMQRHSPDWNGDLWVALRDLHGIRNSLMHYDSGPVIASDERVSTFPEHLLPVAKRLGTLAIRERGGTWLEVFLNVTVAKWAYQTAKLGLDTLDSDAWRARAATGPSDLAAEG